MFTKRAFLALAAAFAVQPASAQTTPAAAPPPMPAGPINPRVKLHTTEGDIVIELYVDKAPITARNYLKYVDRKLYDGAAFYRASKPPGQAANDYGVIQGGLQNDPKKVLPPIAHESTRKTGLLHKDGTISMGRHAPGSAQADWFICVGEQTYLDATPTEPGFAAFGQVTEGMDVVRKILGAPVDPKRGEGAMKGEMIIKPIRILTVRRVAG